MTEWLRDGLEGHSLKATLRLYLLGLMVLAPAAALLALAFGGQASFVATPLLVFIVVAVEYAISYRARLRKDFGELLWMVRRLIENKRRIGRIRVLSPDFGTQVGNAVVFHTEEKTFESIVHEVLYDRDTSVRASAAAALGAIGDPRAVDALINALQDEDPTVRYWAVLALGEIGDLEKCFEPLSVSAVEDKDASVRSSADEALSRMIKRMMNLVGEDIVTAMERAEKKLRRMVTIDESEGAPLKNKDVSKPDEPVRKRP